MELVDPAKDPRELFHGTSVDGVKGICENGFRLPEWSDDNMFGQGAYFATDSSKSAQELYTKGSNRIMLCEVLLGKACEVTGLKDKYPLRKHLKRSTISRCQPRKSSRGGVRLGVRKTWWVYDSWRGSVRRVHRL